MSTLHRCICCGRDLDARLQFPRNSQVCTLCAGMSANEASITTRATIERERMLSDTTIKGRTERRRIKYLEAYAAAGGKRCGSCHGIKPLDAFGVCNPRSDGLQANCKACNKTETLLRAQPGGAAIWNTVKASMRATNDERNG